MNLFKVVVTAVLATLATIAFGITAVWAMWPKAAEASVGIAQHASGWQGHNGDHCAHFDNRHIRIGEAVISAGLDLNDDQEATLRLVAARAETLSDTLRETCETTDMTTLDGSLQGVEAALTKSAQAVGDLRPLVIDFYAGLDDNQREVLHRHMQKHRRHIRGRHGAHRNPHGVDELNAG